jgi:hypothetical protein
LTSPPIDTTAAAPPLRLTFWRWLNSDYPGFMTSIVEVFDGTTWHAVYQSTPGLAVFDNAWQFQAFDISAYSNANLQVRFGHTVTSGGVFTVSGWNVDELRLSDGTCPGSPSGAFVDPLSF